MSLILVSLCGLISCVSHHKHLLVHLSCHSISKTKLEPFSKPRNPPSVVACALDPGVDATAAARPELRSRLPFTAVHRTVHRPQHIHGSSPSTLDARVPATKNQAHDHTARLTIDSSQPGVSTAHSSTILQKGS